MAGKIDLFKCNQNNHVGNKHDKSFFSQIMQTANIISDAAKQRYQGLKFCLKGSATLTRARSEVVDQLGLKRGLRRSGSQPPAAVAAGFRLRPERAACQGTCTTATPAEPKEPPVSCYLSRISE